jgi:hypothetical protein
VIFSRRSICALTQLGGSINGAGTLVSKPLAPRWSVDVHTNCAENSCSYHDGVDHGNSLHLVAAAMWVTHFPWQAGSFRADNRRRIL